MSRMEITPIKLPPALKLQARRRALARKLSLAEYVRSCIRQDIQSAPDDSRNPFTGVPAFKGPMPVDGAANLDKYLRPVSRQGRRS